MRISKTEGFYIPVVPYKAQAQEMLQRVVTERMYALFNSAWAHHFGNTDTPPREVPLSQVKAFFQEALKTETPTIVEGVPFGTIPSDYMTPSEDGSSPSYLFGIRHGKAGIIVKGEDDFQHNRRGLALFTSRLVPVRVV